jgi:hypothetical protein
MHSSLGWKKMFFFLLAELFWQPTITAIATASETAASSFRRMKVPGILRVHSFGADIAAETVDARANVERGRASLMPWRAKVSWSSWSIAVVNPLSIVASVAGKMLPGSDAVKWIAPL